MAGGVYQRGNSWYYYFNAGKKADGSYKKICRKGGSTKEEAEKALTLAKSEYIKTGDTKQDSNISVADYFKYWLGDYVETNLKHSTYNNYKRVINKHIIPSLGKYKLKELGPKELTDFLNNKKRNGYSKASVDNFYGILSGALKQAVYPNEYIKENPMQYVKLPKYPNKKKKEPIILTKKEFNKILKRFPHGSNFYVNIQIAFHTGLRAGEVCGLTWDNIDFDNGTLTVDKQLVKEGPIWTFTTPKTKSSYRTIKIGDTLLNILRKHKLWQQENQLKYGPYYDKTTYKFFDDIYTSKELLSTKENGEPITTNSFKYLSRVVNYELGINFNFHALRHTHATLLLEAGANPKDIQERLGHAKLSTTMDTYSHVTDKMKQHTVDIFETLVVNK